MLEPSKNHRRASSGDVVTSATSRTMNMDALGKSYLHLIRGFMLVWLDINMDPQNDDDSKKITLEFNKFISDIHIFADIDKCSRFINNAQHDQVVLIASGSLGSKAVPIVNNLAQVKIIYIFCGNRAAHEKWAKNWSKVYGVFTDVSPILQSLKQATFERTQNFNSLSFFNLNNGSLVPIFDSSDSKFLYMHVIKKIILSKDFDRENFNEFITYSRKIFGSNNRELQMVEQVASEYHHHPPAWWYTHRNFLYSILTGCLHKMDYGFIVKAGYFMRELHNHVAVLHKQQSEARDKAKKFRVYHAQGLSQQNFREVVQTKPGFVSFNNFLLARMDRDASVHFLSQTMKSDDLVGVLFVIEVEPLPTHNPFAHVEGVSPFQEDEVLFSMHTTFRVNRIQRMDNERSWQIDLTLINDADRDFHESMTQIDMQTFPNTKGWIRLGMLLNRQGDYLNAQFLYDVLLDQTKSESESANIYQQLGIVKENQQCYVEAITNYKKSLDIFQKILPPTDPRLAQIYSSLGLLYDKIGDYTSALAFHEKTLEIDEKSLPANHPSLATSYNNIGLVYDNMGNPSKALSFYEKALAIYESALSPNHPELATAYNNIGWAYRNMQDSIKALQSFERALNILQHSLPSDHPDIQDVEKSIAIMKSKT